jgi:uridine kinase
MIELEQAIALILARRNRVPASCSLLVGLSGIDGSGKGYLARHMSAALRNRGFKVASLAVDDWADAPERRFDRNRPAEHFYEHGFRFEEMFRDFILPLKLHRSCRLETLRSNESQSALHPHVFEFENVDIILLEGIFLLKRKYRDHFDLTIWVECSFETAMERAVKRAQEGLPPDETTRAYETIFFPAQRVHFERDNPRSSADLIIVNDHRLKEAGGGSHSREGAATSAMERGLGYSA